MTHQVTVPDEMWDWAEQQCRARGEGPASFLRAIITGAMVNMSKQAAPSNADRSYAHLSNTVATNRAKQAIIDVLEGRKVYAHACRAILDADDWDFVDPANMMQKPPHEVKDFLECCSHEAGMYADMFASRRNLLKMIFDAYMRAHGGYTR